ncbi:MAG: hypothetical protein KGM42_18095 [Hyphomicrobiales bacterium]|nr:hypothetical protein [Hyphomicrobiales bacterium]
MTTGQQGWRALSRLYHAFLTGSLLRVASRRGSADAAELLFRIFRRQHLATFLPGLDKLGLTGLPHAVACAQYHYLSNQIGGVRVEYMPESDRKAWVRYAPPRWIWEGTAICGVTGDMSRAVLRGWHAHNGVTLKNPRLGFVCTKQTPDGQDGLEGYYCEYDHDLAPDERLRFSRGEEAPPFDPDKAPKLPASTWPQERLDKAARNYTMEYIRSLIPEATDLFGPLDAQWLIGGAARLVGMHFYDECRNMLGLSGAGAEGFAEFFLRMARAGDEDVARAPGGPRDALTIVQNGWRLMRGIDPLHPQTFDVWNELWAGCLAAHDRFLRWNGHCAAGGFAFSVTPRSFNALPPA